MFGFGFGEILLLMAIGLIVLGPKQLPQVARVIGRTLGELKKALHDVSAQVAINLDEEHRKTQNLAPPTVGIPPQAQQQMAAQPVVPTPQVANHDHHAHHERTSATVVTPEGDGQDVIKKENT